MEYCDCRDADNAFKAFNNRTILGARLAFSRTKTLLDSPIPLDQGEVYESHAVRVQAPVNDEVMLIIHRFRRAGSSVS